MPSPQIQCAKAIGVKKSKIFSGTILVPLGYIGKEKRKFVKELRVDDRWP